MRALGFADDDDAFIANAPRPLDRLRLVNLRVGGGSLGASMELFRLKLAPIASPSGIALDMDSSASDWLRRIFFLAGLGDAFVNVCKSIRATSGLSGSETFGASWSMDASRR